MRIAQIKDFPNYIVSSDGKVYNKKGKELHPNNRHLGYKSVTLCKNGEKYTKSIHRLVAIAFIPNPLNYPFVNHKDENPANNDVSNLEWCTAEYNNNYGTRIARQIESQLNRSDCSKAVRQYDLNGNFIAEYPSLKEAWRQTNVMRSGISRCCNRYKQSTAGGFVWEWGG